MIIGTNDSGSLQHAEMMPESDMFPENLDVLIDRIISTSDLELWASLADDEKCRMKKRTEYLFSNDTHKYITMLKEAFANNRHGAMLITSCLSPAYFLSLDCESKDFTAQVHEGDDKGKSVLWFLAREAAFTRGPQALLKVLLRIFELHKDKFTPKDFTAQAQNGYHKGQSLLWLLAQIAAKKKPQALLWVLDQYGDSFEAEDFIAQAQSGHHKGKSVLWVLAQAAAKRRPEALLRVLAQHKGQFVSENFTFQIKKGPNQGRSVLFLLAKAAAKGMPEALLELLQQYKDKFTPEDFTAQARESSDKGKSVLLLLANAAAKEMPEALLEVLQQYKDVFTPEDFTTEAHEGSDKGNSVISVLHAAQKRNSKSFRACLKIISDIINSPQISGGVANKYLRPENRTSLNAPKTIYAGPETQLRRPTPKSVFQCVSLQAFSEQNVQTIMQHKKQEIHVDNVCKFSFYSQNLEIEQDMPCVFIMAGRKNNAHFLMPSEGVRTILVLSKHDLDDIAQPIPASLDYLVIEELKSPSHGDFKKEALGLITPRRISAFMFSHYFKINHCIVCDDNIAKITLADESKDLNSKHFYASLIAQLGGSFSVSIQTISNKPIQIQHEEKKLGSKIFAYNMSSIRNIFTKPEHLFYLLPPSNCISWWGEDYLMQCVLHEIAKPLGNDGFKTLSMDAFGGLYRMQQHRNSFQKIGSTAEDYIERHSDFIDGINFAKVEPAFEQPIKNSLEYIKRLVEERIKRAAEKKRRLAQLDIERAHAQANKIVIIDGDTNKRPTANLKSKETFSIAIDELETVKDILYPHQMNALQSLLKTRQHKAHMNLCTGAGKTRVQIAFAHLCATKICQPIFIVAPTRELVQQTYDEFINTQIDFAQKLNCALLKQEVIKVSSTIHDLSQGLLNQNHRRNKNVFIFCEDSFKLFMSSDRYFAPSALIFDEYHNISSSTITKAINKNNRNEFIPVIGLSATPDIKKHPSLKHEIFRYTREEALKDGRVAPIVIDKFNKAYDEKVYQEMLKRTPEILQNHFHPNGKLLCNNKGIIYVASIEDADALSKRINEAGIPSFPVHSKASKDNLKNFKQSSASVAVAVRMLRVGFDDPTVNYAIDLQNPNNGDIFTQIVGRAMRINLLDPRKIGYIITYKDANTANFNVTTDEIAIARASSVYKFRNTTINKLTKIFNKMAFVTKKNTSQILNEIDCVVDDCYQEYRHVVKPALASKYLNEMLWQEDLVFWDTPKNYKDVKEQLEEYPSFYTDEREKDKVAFFKSSKTKMRAQLCKEYDRFKKSSFFIHLRKLDKKLIPNNQALYESRANKEAMLISYNEIRGALGEIIEHENIGVNTTFSQRAKIKVR